MRALLATLLLLPCAALAADGDACSTQGYETFTNAAGCLVVCDEKTTAGECNAGTGYAPPAGYRSGIVEVEIAKDTATSCTVEVRSGASSAERHLRTTLTCGEAGVTAANFAAGQGVAGRLYFEITEITGGTIDVVAHFEKGED